MLTESELAWLEHRDAMQFLTGTYIADFAEYPLWNSGKDWQDVAEFEARVAVKLADAFFFELAPDDVRMMLARLAVEETDKC